MMIRELRFIGGERRLVTARFSPNDRLHEFREILWVIAFPQVNAL